MALAAAAIGEEERKALRDVAREVLAARSSSERVHALVDAGGVDEDLWALMAELSWPAVVVPEELGGVGYGLAGLAPILEEVGRHLTGTPLGPTTVAATALLAAPAGERRDALLAEIAAGGRRLAVAPAVALGPADGSGPELSGEAEALRLRGALGLVWAGAEADELLVLARHGGGIAAVLVAADAPGLEIVSEQPIDRTRSLAAMRAEDVAVAGADLIASAAAATVAARALVDSMALAIALDSVGGAEAALAETVAYAKDRVQFDRPIGSFQAVKHACADMFVAVEAARSALEVALGAAAGEDPEETSRAVSAAKAYCADAYAAVAGQAVQLHGGIGFTWEADCQLHLKRAKLNQQLGGSSGWHRQRVATLLFGP